MIKLCISEDNFQEGIKSLQSKSFQETQYRFLWDQLFAKSRKYLIEHDLPKNKILIYATASRDRDFLVVSKKYKHEMRILGRKIEIQDVINNILAGKGTKEEILKNLSEFENFEIRKYLSFSCMRFKHLSIPVSEIDKYTYSEYFPYLVTFRLFGLKGSV